MSVQILLVLTAMLLAVAVLAVALRPVTARRITYGLTLVLTAAAVLIGAPALFGGAASADLVLPLGLPWIGARFALDPLSAFFLVLVDFGAAAASLYGLGYGRHEEAPGRVLPFFPAFVAGMNLVLLAADAFTFLFSFELMSVTSWALVIAHHRVAENRQAGYVYLLMAVVATLALLLAFALLAGSVGGYDFATMRARSHTPALASVVLLLALVGAGAKSGLMPLHAWLPLAHPAAPSHVSALMSGVMTKVAVYAFIRIVFDLAGPPAWWWGIIVLVVGAATAVLGILHALIQTDLKRLLAFSTVENVGLVFVGLGLALAFHAAGMEAAAALGMTAALLHALNHMLFKSLLFFGAGAVLSATGLRDIERLGGLIRRMPLTAGLFLVGSMAIAALPPLNGFVSEWLSFQTMLLSPDLPSWTLKLMVPAVAAVLALTAALAAACFIRAFGVVFLGRPRSAEAAEAHEVDHFALAGMAVLAFLCLAIGVLPGLAIDAIGPAVQLTVGSTLPAQAGGEWLSIVPIAEGRSSYDGLLVFVFASVSAMLAAFAIHRLASRALRRAPAWDCGFPEPSPATQYSGTSFAQPIRRVFAVAFAAGETVDMPAPGELRPARLVISLRDLIWEGLYLPLAAGVTATGIRLNAAQFLTIRRYLMMVFLALILLLIVMAVQP